MTDAKLKEIEARVALVRTESASSATGAAWTSTYQASAADVPALLAALRTERARATDMHRRAQRLEGIEARLERVRAGYDRLVDHLRQVRRDMIWGVPHGKPAIFRAS